MFHTYNFGTSTFQDWLGATNQLYYNSHLESEKCPQDYQVLQARDIKAQPQDQFLFYIDDEVGLCGSAALTALPYDLDVEGQVVPQDTWVLQNVFFHIRRDHAIEAQPDKFRRIVAQFYLGLFDHLWQLAQRSDHQIALSLQNNWQIHADLEGWGGFTFKAKLLAREEDREVAMGVMSLTGQTYDIYQQKLSTAQRLPKEVYMPLLLPKGQLLKRKKAS